MEVQGSGIVDVHDFVRLRLCCELTLPLATNFLSSLPRTRVKLHLLDEHNPEALNQLRA